MYKYSHINKCLNDNGLNVQAGISGEVNLSGA